MTDRGVSEVVGFVLVFSLVLSTVVVVYAMGFPGLEDRRDVERVANAERAFDVFADNVDDLREYGDPARATEIKLADASLDATGSTRLTAEITNLGSPPPTYSVELEPVVYEAGGGTRVVYEGGAVLRVQPGGAVMKRAPGMVFASDGGTRTTVLPLLQTRGVGRTSVGGSTTVRVRTDFALAEMLTARGAGGGPYDVAFTVETTPDRAPAWERFLDGRLSDAYGVSDPCSTAGDTVTCTFETHRLYVSATRVDVTFS